MDLLQHLEIYINAQKTIGLQSILFAIAFLITALLFHFFGDSTISAGLKVGSLICAVVLIVLGVGLRMNQEKLLQRQTILYQKDRVEFKEFESTRMQQVKDKNPRDKRTIIVLIIVLLVVFLFIKHPFWQGVLFCFIVFLLGIMIIDVFSFHSIKAYYEQLTD